MSFKSKEEKKRTLQKLLRILWTGNVTEAILYLRNLNPGVLRPNHRVRDLTGYLEKHREHIPCYALRAELGLRNSSNRVEKENDLVVAQRQKRNGKWRGGTAATVRYAKKSGKRIQIINPVVQS